MTTPTLPDGPTKALLEARELATPGYWRFVNTTKGVDVAMPEGNPARPEPNARFVALAANTIEAIAAELAKVCEERDRARTELNTAVADLVVAEKEIDRLRHARVLASERDGLAKENDRLRLEVGRLTVRLVAHGVNPARGE